jgi:cell division septum initiation protein DivIVA
MDILQLLDKLETVLASGSRIPLSGKTVVDEHECMDILDQLRVAIPEEVKQAKRVHADRERLIRDAEDQASRIVAHAQDQVSSMVEQHEIARAAEARARKILQDAEIDAAECRDGADRYAADTLAQLEQYLNEQLGVVRNGMRALSRRDYPEREETDE